MMQLQPNYLNTRQHKRWLNQRLIALLGLCWSSFILLGLVLNHHVAHSSVIVLVDRSYCAPNRWQQLVQQYEQLYDQHQLNQIQIESVLLFSNLGEERISPPLPEVLRTLPVYGRSDLKRQQQMQTKYPGAILLTCP